MTERRRFTRSNLPQKAQFFGVGGWEDCLITGSSRKGLSVTFYTKEKMTEGSILHLKVSMPTEQKPVVVKGILQWIERKEDHFIGGLEWFSIDKDSR